MNCWQKTSIDEKKMSKADLKERCWDGNKMKTGNISYEEKTI